MTAAAKVPITEKAFMQAILDYARLNHWLCYHTHDSRKSARGFPDIVAIRAGRLVVIECKVGRGRLTRAQETWLGVFGGVPCAEVYVVYPTPEWWAEIERIFR